jgi:F-type H+-transporting ATPase subunit a
MKVTVESHPYAYVNIGGTDIPFITDTVIAMWLVTLTVVLLVVLCTRRMELVPKGTQRWAEALVNFINSLAGGIGKPSKAFAPFLCTLLLFLVGCNILAIFNIIPSGAFLARINPAWADFEFGLEPPTKNINVTACLAITTIIVVIYAEFRYKGVKGWLRSFYKPSPVNAFTKLLDYIVRPLSLCLRLFGNMLGGYITLMLLYGALPIILPAFASMYLYLFDGVLQAYVFIFLTATYLTEAVEVPE